MAVIWLVLARSVTYKGATVPLQLINNIVLLAICIFIGLATKKLPTVDLYKITLNATNYDF